MRTNSRSLIRFTVLGCLLAMPAIPVKQAVARENAITLGAGLGFFTPKEGSVRDIYTVPMFSYEAFAQFNVNNTVALMASCDYWKADGRPERIGGNPLDDGDAELEIIAPRFTLLIGNNLRGEGESLLPPPADVNCSVGVGIGVPIISETITTIDDGLREKSEIDVDEIGYHALIRIEAFTSEHTGFFGKAMLSSVKAEGAIADDVEFGGISITFGGIILF